MYCKQLSIFIGYLVVVNSFHVPKKIITKSYDVAEEYSIEPLDAVDPSAWSEVVVIQMHYDCRGFLMRQEVSKLRTLSGVARVPGEDPYKTMSSAYNEEIQDTAPEPVYFRSMRKRFRTPATKRPTQERPAKGQPVQERLDEGKPSQERLDQQVNPEKIGPDTIIGVPIRPCPEGQNDDFTGKCKAVFPEA